MKSNVLNSPETEHGRYRLMVDKKVLDYCAKACLPLVFPLPDDRACVISALMLQREIYLEKVVLFGSVYRLYLDADVFSIYKTAEGSEKLNVGIELEEWSVCEVDYIRYFDKDAERETLLLRVPENEGVESPRLTRYPASNVTIANNDEGWMSVPEERVAYAVEMGYEWFFRAWKDGKVYDYCLPAQEFLSILKCGYCGEVAAGLSFVVTQETGEVYTNASHSRKIGNLKPHQFNEARDLRVVPSRMQLQNRRRTDAGGRKADFSLTI